MKIDTVFVAIAIALACVLAGAVKVRAQDPVAVSGSRAPDDASGDTALAENPTRQQAKDPSCASQS